MQIGKACVHSRLMNFVEPIRDRKKIAQIKNQLRGERRYRDLLLFVVGINTGGAQGGTPGVFASSDQKLGKGSHATLGDVDGDSDLDALTCQGLWLNDGDGTFRGPGTSFDVPDCGGVWLGDVDGDGDLDALIASRKQDNELWLNESH